MSTLVTRPVRKRIFRAPRNKPQARTLATKAKLIDAAQTLFAEQGFENTQLEEVAARAGYSRGAIYAHYANKEDLFLELMEQRVHKKLAVLRKHMESEPDVRKRRETFKGWMADQVCDPSWGTLMLEFKLYAVRRLELREKLVKLYEALLKDAGKDLVEALFGKDLSKGSRTEAERRLAVISGALSGLVLESHFRPALLPAKHLREMTLKLIEALIEG
jgi:AcrR family transcriptional regulator